MKQPAIFSGYVIIGIIVFMTVTISGCTGHQPQISSAINQPTPAPRTMPLYVTIGPSSLPSTTWTQAKTTGDIPQVPITPPVTPSSGIIRSKTNISGLLASEPPDTVVVYFFYHQLCEDCHQAVPFMEGFKERHPTVIVRSFDLTNNTDNQQLLRELNKRYGVNRYLLPTVFTGEWELIGNENIQVHLDEIVSQEEANMTFLS